MINAETKKELLKQLFNRKEYLPDDPERVDLWKYVKGLKTKRLKKKFLSNPSHYTPRFLPQAVFWEFVAKAMGKPMAEYIRMQLNQESFARRLFIAEPVSETHKAKAAETLVFVN